MCLKLFVLKNFLQWCVWCLFSSVMYCNEYLPRDKIHDLKMRGLRDVYLFLLLTPHLKLQGRFSCSRDSYDATAGANNEFEKKE